MPPSNLALKSLFKISQLDHKSILQIINTSVQLKNKTMTPALQEQNVARDKIVALVFLEPSTRTRFSFEIACHRLGLRFVSFTAGETTSTAKGESLHETLNTLLAMGPEALVLRAPEDAQVLQVIEGLAIPFVNAGWGTDEHPTQALLDAMTVFERKGKIEGEKILFVGDLQYSRVAHSSAQLFKSLGAKIGYVSPQEFTPEKPIWREADRFSNVGDAMKWASVCMGLRIQKERHGNKNRLDSNYIDNFRIDRKNIKNLSSDAVIMHPGPFVPNEDLTEEILNDPRCAIREQVTNGVFVRMAVLGELLGLPYT